MAYCFNYQRAMYACSFCMANLVATVLGAAWPRVTNSVLDVSGIRGTSPAPTDAPILAPARYGSLGPRRRQDFSDISVELGAGNTCGYDDANAVHLVTCDGPTDVCTTNAQLGLWYCCDPQDCGQQTRQFVSCWDSSYASYCTGDCTGSAPGLVW